MAAGCRSLDQWKIDAFFSAAEEVQESADKMESVHRIWMRGRAHALNPEEMVELQRELRMALGMAKWQLEEFERAVKLSYDDHAPNKSTVVRHREFADALKNQVFVVEKDLGDFLVEKGEERLNWVQLNEEERNDLACFLSAGGPSVQGIRNKIADEDFGSQTQATTEDHTSWRFKDFAMANKVKSCSLEAQNTESLVSKDKLIAYERCLYGERDWKIAVVDQQEELSKPAELPETTKHTSLVSSLQRSVESNWKSEYSKYSLPKYKVGELQQYRRRLSSCIVFRQMRKLSQGISCISERSRNFFYNYIVGLGFGNARQLIGRVNALQRHKQYSPNHGQLGRSFQFIFFMMLMILFIVPFVYCSS